MHVDFMTVLHVSEFVLEKLIFVMEILSFIEEL
jgi:hypothetical protein